MRAGSPQMGKRILIVDDEEGMALLVRTSLARLSGGHEMETANSGEEALGKMASRSFDLVITDLRMPGMDGLELIERIQACYPGTRLVLMTACGSAEVEATASQLGVQGYLTKPFVKKKMLATVQAALV
jgi:DNA-binding NtrC family response regulator